MGGLQRYRAAFNGLVHDVSIPIERLRDPGRGLKPRETGAILIHIPKCGGVSLRHALGLPYYGHRLLCDYGDDRLAKAEAIVFCTRDPFERMVSTFSYLQRLRRSSPLLYIAAASPRLTTFTQFVQSDSFNRLESYHFFFRSQYQYLKGIEKYRGKAVHLRFDRLSEDFKNNFGGDLQTLNSSIRSHDEDIDTPANRERVRSVYRADYELLSELLAG